MTVALQALKIDPTCIPAAVLAASHLAKAGKLRRATTVLRDSWDICPHPDLAQAWADQVPDESPLDRVSRLQTAFGTNPPPESLLVLAQAAVAAQLWGQARGWLEAALKLCPSRAVYLLLASLERHEKNDIQAAAQWTEQAGTAVADPHWQCANCGGHSPRWAAVCPQCGRSVSLVWSA